MKQQDFVVTAADFGRNIFRWSRNLSKRGADLKKYRHDVLTGDQKLKGTMIIIEIMKGEKLPDSVSSSDPGAVIISLGTFLN